MTNPLGKQLASGGILEVTDLNIVINYLCPEPRSVTKDLCDSGQLYFQMRSIRNHSHAP